MKHTGNVALVLCIVIIAGFVNEHFKRKKIAVVQLQQLVYEFQGMKSATEKYTAKINKWSTQADSMENTLRALVDEMKMDSININKVKLNQDHQKFYFLQKSYYEYRQKTEQKAQQEDKSMTEGVMNQVNNYIKAFAQQEGYDVIISNTQMQNIGYVNEASDVTKQLIEFANKKYEGGN